MLLGLVFLLLPVAGFLFIREIEQLLRLGQEQAVIANARAIVDRINADQNLRQALEARNTDQSTGGLYVYPTQAEISVDGYNDDWQFLKLLPQTFTAPDLSMSIQLLVNERAFYGFIEVNDSNFKFHNPKVSYPAAGDFVVLRIGASDQAQLFILRTSAPGAMQVATLENDVVKIKHTIRALWRQREGGYQIEFTVPKKWADTSLTVGVYDAQSNTGLTNLEWMNAQNRTWLKFIERKNNPLTISIKDELQQVAEVFTHNNNRVRVVDDNRWVLADKNLLHDEEFSAPPLAWLIRGLLNTQPLPQVEREIQQTQLPQEEVVNALATKEVVSRWYQWNQSSNVLRVVYPIVSKSALHKNLKETHSNGLSTEPVGAVVIEQTTVQWLSLADQAFKRLLGYSVLTLIVVGVILFLYASWLSLRIQRLNRAAANAVNSDGSITNHFPKSRLNDEIGDLNRRYAELLERIGDYNHYLKTLADKLSHELRTPLAIVKSSLDNIETCKTDDERHAYITRANSGVERLSKILTAMNSAKRIEEAIEQAESEIVDLTQLVGELGAAYIRLTADKPFSVTVSVPSEPLKVEAAPDLIVQMLDKLFDNAVSFCNEGGTIHLSLTQTNQGCLLSVNNTGPLLPSHMAGQLFASMVSMRDKQSKSTHLGLGLFIVKLVVDFHGGEVSARNREDGRGVVFDVLLARAKDFH